MVSIMVDEIETYYEIPCGLQLTEGQTLALLIHGGGGSSQHWLPLLPFLPKSIVPLLVDLPGNGRSSGTVLPSIDAAATFLERFLTRLGVQQPLCCIGHSLGGMIALRFALLFPHRVSSLALIATGARITMHTDFLTAALSNTWDVEMFRTTFGSDIPRELQDLILYEYPKMRVDASSTDFMSLREFDLRVSLSSFQVPTLIITGDDDVVISPRHSRFLHKEISGSHLVVIPGGGHYVYAEQPERVAEELRRLL